MVWVRSPRKKSEQLRVVDQKITAEKHCQQQEVVSDLKKKILGKIKTVCKHRNTVDG